MDNNKVAAMVNRVAGTPPEVTPEEEALLTIDTAFDRILRAIGDIEANIPKINPQGPKETEAKKKIQELFETAINPYFSDALDSWGVFEGEE